MDVWSPLRNPYARRLVVAVLTLVVIERFEPEILSRAEQARYESDTPYRFGNADMFSVGPFVSYLRDHPRGDRPRIAFIGPSTVWGYSLESLDSIPAQFQRLAPEYRVFNLGMTRLQTGSAYLMAKAIIDSVETIFLFDARTSSAEPLMAQWIPVADDDVERFGLTPRSRIDRWLQQGLNRWRLYRDSYRLQSAWLGTSTRVWLYTNKASLVRDVLQRGRRPSEEQAPPPASNIPPASRVELHAPKAPTVPDTRRRDALKTSIRTGVLWEFGVLVRARHKHAVMVELEAGDVSDDALADLNSVFSPEVTFLRLIAPKDLMNDPLHFNADGAAQVASALHNLQPPVNARH